MKELWVLSTNYCLACETDQNRTDTEGSRHPSESNSQASKPPGLWLVGLRGGLMVCLSIKLPGDPTAGEYHAV